METVLRNVAVGYARLFPELLDRFYNEDDQSIVNLIAEKSENKVENNIVDIGKLKKDIVSLLNKGL